MVKMPTVLVVDSDRKRTEILVRAFGARRFTSFGAHSYVDAARLLHIIQADLVVVNPRVAEGFDLIEAVRRDYRSVGIIGMVESPDDVPATRAEGVPVVVVIPQESDQLIDSILLCLEEDMDQNTRQGSMRVLVVDDEDEIVNIVTTFLEDRGYDVISAASGDEALVMLDHDSNIGVVLLDVVMPGRDGIETLREVMQRPEHPNVIMMTARADDKIFEAVRLGAVDYLLKPIDFEALDSTLAACLGRSE